MTAPPPILDAHLHIIDPRFPLAPAGGYVPDPFTAEDYRAAVAGLGIVGGVVVSGSFQGTASDHLLAALATLGPGFAGVVQLGAGASGADIGRLAAAGVRGARWNLRRGGSAGLEDLERLARLAWEVAGWHIEVHVDGRDLPELEPRLAALPRVGIDHLGLHRDGLRSVLRLAAGGAKVKASGFGRVDLDVPSTLRAIAEVDPSALLFGTDLPSTRAPRPFAARDVGVVLDALGPDLGRRALFDNARSWYGITPGAGPAGPGRPGTPP